MATIHNNKYLSIPDPEDINTTVDLMDTFGHFESETSANFIVRYCKSVGNWSPFTFEQINDFYLDLRGKKPGDRNFSFNKLVSEGWITKDRDLFYVTLGFLGKLQPYTIDKHLK